MPIATESMREATAKPRVYLPRRQSQRRRSVHARVATAATIDSRQAALSISRATNHEPTHRRGDPARNEDQCADDRRVVGRGALERATVDAAEDADRERAEARDKIASAVDQHCRGFVDGPA